MRLLPFDLDLAFSVEVDISDPEPIGVTYDGLRINFRALGGRVFGPELMGSILPSGGDWLTLRPDGVLLLDVHLTVKVNDKLNVGLAYTGRGDAGEKAFEEFLAGKLPEVPIPLRATMRLETQVPFKEMPLPAKDRKALEKLAALSRRYLLGIGEADVRTRKVLYNFYSVGPDYAVPGQDATAGQTAALAKV